MCKVLTKSPFGNFSPDQLDLPDLPNAQDVRHKLAAFIVSLMTVFIKLVKKIRDRQGSPVVVAWDCQDHQESWANWHFHDLLVLQTRLLGH